jgi:predicted enzyme related to lactoylglutathione lyase
MDLIRSFQGGRPMAQMTSLAGSAVPAVQAVIGAPQMPIVPTTRTVPSLARALVNVRRAGGSVTSETRTVPGIGSWAFVTDREGTEVVLWEAASLGEKPRQQ